jgi:hypothetical protein
VVVTDDGIVVGMPWREHVLDTIRDGNSVRVRDVMDRDVTPMEASEPVYDVHQRMLATGYPAIRLPKGESIAGSLRRSAWSTCTATSTTPSAAANGIADSPARLDYYSAAETGRHCFPIMPRPSKTQAIDGH